MVRIGTGEFSNGLLNSSPFIQRVEEEARIVSTGNDKNVVALRSKIFPELCRDVDSALVVYRIAILALERRHNALAEI